jgi:hypothetical protein
VFFERTSVGLDVHARSVVACAIDGRTGEIRQVSGQRQRAGMAADAARAAHSPSSYAAGGSPGEHQVRLAGH